MLADWRLLPGKMAPITCNMIVDQALKIPERQALVGLDGHVDHDYRESTVRWLDAREIDPQDGQRTWAPVLEEIRFWLDEANRDLFAFDCSWIKHLQFTTYREDRHGHFQWHKDTFWVDPRTPTHRKLTFVLQLSDPADYDGGDFEFDREIKPASKDDLRKQGSILIFPSFFYHRVTPVIRGTRHCLVAWYEGPKWR